MCGLERFDRVFHYMNCPVMEEGWRVAAGAFTFPNGRQWIIQQFCLGKSMTNEEIAISCIICDVFLKTFNSVRTGGNPARAMHLMKARMRFWSVRSDQYGNQIRNWIARSLSD